MYALVLYVKTKDVSVVGEDCVVGDIGVGNEVTVKYGSKKYRATVILASDDKEWLDKQNVSVDGKILPQGMEKHIAECRAAKKVLWAEAKATNVSKEKVLRKHAKNLLDLAVPATSKASSLQNTESLEVTSVLDENLNEASQISVTTADMTEMPPSVEVIKAKETCKSCSAFPTVSSEIVRFLSEFSSYVSDRHEKELRRQYSRNPSDTTAKDGLQTMKQQFSEGKVELKPGSGVFANKEFLKDLKRDYRKKPNVVVRRLCRLLVGDEFLQATSAKGEGGFDSIPGDVKDAIKYDDSKKGRKKAAMSNWVITPTKRVSGVASRTTSPTSLHSPTRSVQSDSITRPAPSSSLRPSTIVRELFPAPLSPQLVQPTTASIPSSSSSSTAQTLQPLPQPSPISQPFQVSDHPPRPQSSQVFPYPQFYASSTANTQPQLAQPGQSTSHPYPHHYQYSHPYHAYPYFSQQMPHHYSASQTSQTAQNNSFLPQLQEGSPNKRFQDL